VKQQEKAVIGAERLHLVSVPRAVAAFLIAGLVVLTAIGVALALALRHTATDQAILDARALTDIEATSVVGPILNDQALVPGPGRDALNRVVRQRVLGERIVRVKIWDATGRIVYSDDASLIGKRFPLEGEELAALRTGGASAEVSDLARSENLAETQYDKLLQVYQGVQTPTGQRLLFETYQPYEVITEASRRTWLTSLPVLLGGLVLLYLLQAPLAYRMARNLKRSQDEREALLLATLAASDRERATIAADLHDGIVQGLAGASYSLSAAAGRARDGDAEAARVMAGTAEDLRRWVRELRSLVVTITPPQLHVQGLAETLADLAATLEVRGIAATVSVSGTEQLDEATETLVYRAAQEAIRNIVRHADASSVTLTVTRDRTVSSDREDHTLQLRVRDNGCGFDAASSDARSRGSVGLELLGALVTSQGGTLTLDASPGKGTELVVRVPVEPMSAPVTPDRVREQQDTEVLR